MLVFTSRFEKLDDFKQDEIDKIIFYLHALRINVVFFYYELGSGSQEVKDKSINPRVTKSQFRRSITLAQDDASKMEKMWLSREKQ